MNPAWRGLFQAKKIKRKNRYGRSNYRLVAIPEAVRHAIEEWRRECRNTEENTLMFPGTGARGRKPLDKPMPPDNWLRLRFYPLARQLKIPFHPTFQVLRRGFPPTASRRHIRHKCRLNWATAIFGRLWISTPGLWILRF